jgi:hypothetical protein
MADSKQNKLFLFEALFLISMLFLLAVVLMPQFGDARQAARRNGCLNQARQLAMAYLHAEEATQRFPNLSTAEVRVDQMTTAAARGDMGGTSWLVACLPHLEESSLYDHIQESTRGFSLPPFQSGPAFQRDGRHLSEIPLPFLRCPSYSGSALSKASDYGIMSPHVSNYTATTATHVYKDTVIEDGVIVSRVESPAGLTIADISDGASETVLITETREEKYSSWYDGATSWVLGFHPSTFPLEFNAGARHADGYPNKSVLNSDKINLNRPRHDSKFAAAMPANVFGGRSDRVWAASSFHNGLTIHSFVDTHTRAIADDIDPTLYYRILTRAGGEPIDKEGL